MVAVLGCVFEKDVYTQPEVVPMRGTKRLGWLENCDFLNFPAIVYHTDYVQTDTDDPHFLKAQFYRED